MRTLLFVSLLLVTSSATTAADGRRVIATKTVKRPANLSPAKRLIAINGARTREGLSPVTVPPPPQSSFSVTSPTADGGAGFRSVIRPEAIYFVAGGSATMTTSSRASVQFPAIADKLYVLDCAIFTASPVKFTSWSFVMAENRGLPETSVQGSTTTLDNHILITVKAKSTGVLVELRVEASWTLYGCSVTAAS